MYPNLTLSVRTLVCLPRTYGRPDMVGGMYLWPGTPAVAQKPETGVSQEAPGPASQEIWSKTKLEGEG